MEVGQLTLQEKDQLVGQQLAPDWYFNPVEDGNTPPNWVISTQEIDNCINPDYLWVKNLPLIEWVQPIQPPFPPTN